MTGKKNEGKIMSILERSRLVKKVDDSDISPDDTIKRYDPDIKPAFEELNESAAVSPTLTQPISSVVSSANIEGQYGEGNTDQTDDVPPIGTSQYTSANLEEPSTIDDLSETKPYNPFHAPQVPVPLQSDSYAHENGVVSAEQSVSESPYVQQIQPHENYIEKYMSIDELYEVLALKPKKTDSVYLIEEYLKTLPDSLPDSSRREIVSKIIAASCFDYDLLMGDGVLRVKMLKEYAERFARHTDDYVAARKAELEMLEKQIESTKKLIANRKELHKKQFFTIETEAQRLKEILTFISG